MNQSVLKALDILYLFDDETPELTLGNISEKLSMPKPTAYRLLQSLESKGFVTKYKQTEYTSHYRLGYKLMELGILAVEQLEIRQIARPYMKQLCVYINEVVHLVIQEHHEAIYIEKVEGSSPLRLVTRIGKREPLHVGSGPKLLLAYKNESFINDYIETIDFHQITNRGALNKRDLLEELDRIKANGYAVSKGEQDAETIGVSYPVHNHLGNVVAALAVSGPALRFFGDNGKQIQNQTANAAKRISRDLGYSK